LALVLTFSPWMCQMPGAYDTLAGRGAFDP